MSDDINKYSGPRSPEILKVGEQVLNIVVDHQVFSRIRDACRDLIHTTGQLHLKKIERGRPKTGVHSSIFHCK